MNLFYLHQDPKVAARLHCDKHVVKMILETAQMLSCAHHVNGTSVSSDKLYGKTHVHHPSTVWVRSAPSHYKWAYDLFIALCDEYTLRYNKTHLSDTKLRSVLSTYPEFTNDDQTFTPPPLAMPEKYWVSGQKVNTKSSTVVKSYQQYYYYEKRYMAKYTNRTVPSFML